VEVCVSRFAVEALISTGRGTRREREGGRSVGGRGRGREECGSEREKGGGVREIERERDAIRAPAGREASGREAYGHE